ncbi:serine/arginine-rich splicing factor 5-like [Cylas formicarius]|uniref:serine/arginine-rich splicing factor 5-like n=1 Tax=Cylas formicarius TaxID=197179 RepID=UPI00295836D3|nr:serine/arginine-rich splicing factor 5-like [Cylas formicarius]
MNSRVYVSGLSPYTRIPDVLRFFKTFGKIRDVSLHDDHCFVDFYDYRDAEHAAFELDGERLLGNRVTVEVATDKRRRRGLTRFIRNRYAATYPLDPDTGSKLLGDFVLDMKDILRDIDDCSSNGRQSRLRRRSIFGSRRQQDSVSQSPPRSRCRSRSSSPLGGKSRVRSRSRTLSADSEANETIGLPANYTDDSYCGMCREQTESIDHIIRGCPTLAPKEYTKRHYNIGKVIHQELLKLHDTETKDTILHYKYNPKSVVETENYKMYWNREIITDLPLQHNRADLVFTEKKTNRLI